MTCRECGIRKAKRACPALSRDICSVCCATKRLKEIPCPPDCQYLVAARQHPPAAIVRRQQQDLARMVGLLRDFSEAQARLFLVVNRFLAGYRPPDLQRLLDEDVVDAANALAATRETAAKGLIYEHPPSSIPAEKLARALKPILEGAGEGGLRTSDLDSAAVLRRLAEAVQHERQEAPGDPRGYLEFVERVLHDPSPGSDRAEHDGDGAPGAGEEGGRRLIVP